MKPVATVLVAGAGAIGSMVAWQIERASPGAVSVLARGERVERYRKDGFEINGARHDFALTDASSRSEPDLVIVACKAHHLDEVIRDLEEHIGPDTLILSLLNGISSEDILGAAFGNWRIPLAMIIGTDAGHDGNRTTFTKTGTIFFGDAENPGPRENWSPRVLAIANFLEGTGIAWTVPENMKNRLWFKFMLNVGVNQITAVARRPYSILQTKTATPEARRLLEAAMREVIAVARAEGVILTDDDIAAVYATMDGISPEGKTSMCQDVEARRKTEVELFSGTMMELGARHGILVPVNETLHDLISIVERTYL